ncbi:hypothetical protein NDU88_001793 [Pleurodeles waltl]|uniref:Uncharacterized protein n=1 Tax=Pleurodeles waltl TaxID=8319 RepID=A0AAV7MLY3_PLEWA|nr:hypothetical protein NDU88_001793 [Pleurodeles waltl]
MNHSCRPAYSVFSCPEALIKIKRKLTLSGSSVECNSGAKEDYRPQESLLPPAHNVCLRPKAIIKIKPKRPLQRSPEECNSGEKEHYRPQESVLPARPQCLLVPGDAH